MSVTTRLTDDDVGVGGGQKALLPLGLSPDDVNCPICVETISDPFVTSCGHTFCYQCISTHLKHKNSCPSCGDYLTADNIYPNFLLNKILRKAAAAPASGHTSLVDQVQRLLADNMAPDSGPARMHRHPHLLAHRGGGYGSGGGVGSGLGDLAPWGTGNGANGGGRLRLRLRDIDAVLEALYDAREELERRESSDVLHLLLCFLHHAREQKARRMDELRQQLACLEHDIASVQSVQSAGAAGAPGTAAITGGQPAAAAAAALTTFNVGFGPRLRPGSEPATEGALPQLTLLTKPPAPPFAVAESGSAGGGKGMRPPHPHHVAAKTHDATAAAPAVPPSQVGGGSLAAAATAGALYAASPSHLARCQQTGPDPQLRLPAGASPGPGPTATAAGQHPPATAPSGSGPGTGPGLSAAAPRSPLPPSGWCLHTFTPAGSISSVTVDTSSLMEPGQQAEAFSAAVQHAMAAARAAASGSVSDGSGAAAGGGGGCSAGRGRWADPEGVSGDSMDDGCAGGGGSGGGGGDADSAIVTSTDAGPARASCGGGSGGGGGPNGLRRGMPRCGSADNFQLLVRSTGDCGPHPHPQLQLSQHQPPPSTQQQPQGQASLTSDDVQDSGGTAGTGTGTGTGTAGGGGAGGDDCSALSGAGFPGGAGGAAEGQAGEQEEEERREGRSREDAGPRGRGRGHVGARQWQQQTCRARQQQQQALQQPAVAQQGRGQGALGGGAQGPQQQQLLQLQQPCGSRLAALPAAGEGAGAPAAAAGAGVAPPAFAIEPSGTRAPVDALRREGEEEEDEMDVRERRRGRGGTAAAAGGGGPCHAGTGQDERVMRGGREDEEEEDEMDVRERRRGRGRAAFSGQGQPGAPGFAGTCQQGHLPQSGPPPPPGLQHSSGPAAVVAASSAQPHLRGHGAAPPPQWHDGAAGGGATAPPSGPAAEPNPEALQAAKRRRMLSQFEVLERCYLQMRAARPTSSSVSGTAAGAAAATGGTAAAAAAAAMELTSPATSAWRPDLRDSGGAVAAATAAAIACDGAHPLGPGGLCRCDGPHSSAAANVDVDLSSFGAVLAAATQYSRLELLAEIPRYGSGSGSGGLQILSSIEFDLSDNLFATAGVVPRILVYDYQALLAGRSAPRPVTELTARSKLSCLSYSPAVRQHLLAADYQGGVALWDTESGMQVQDYEAHERRVWGVDFSPARHHCFASGSDDGLVKVWSTRQASSCLSLELRGNVCSVEFHPTDPNLLAVGSALHCGLVYDLRQPAAPLHTLLGHRKAVSYVRWLADRPHELVTASTDSTLKLWSLAPPPPLQALGAAAAGSFPGEAAAAPGPVPAFMRDAVEVGAGSGPGGSLLPPSPAAAAAATLRGAQLVRTFSGHTNERNFVGLCTSSGGCGGGGGGGAGGGAFSGGGGDYIACGSETHEVFLYHRSLPQPALRFSFAGRVLGGNGPGPGQGPAAAAAAGQQRPGGGGGGQQGAPPHHFVTALQWRRNSPHLLAANSAGCVWLLGLKL